MSIDKQFLRTRRPDTLVKWWHELNRFGWPKELGIPYEPERDSLMNQLAAELGERWILRKLGRLYT